MEKKKIYRLVLVLALGVLLIACTKSEVRSKKLIKQGRWMMTQLEIGSNNVINLPHWDLESVEDTKQFAPGTWFHYDGSEAAFNWRFDYYEGTFSFKIDQSVEQDHMSKAYIQCENLSGAYTIITDKSNLFEFESTETYGYASVRVFIQIQPL